MTELMSKQELIDALRSSGERVTSAVENVPVEDLDAGRYENGWNGRQILAHLASIEWTYPRLIDLARGVASRQPAATSGQAATRPAPTSADQPGLHGRSPQILSYNDRQVEKRTAVPVSDLIAEFRNNRETTIAAVEAVDDSLLETEVTTAGGAQGPLATVLNFVAVLHVLDHLADITRDGK